MRPVIRCSAGVVTPAVVGMVFAACAGTPRAGRTGDSSSVTASAFSRSAVSGSAVVGSVSRVSCSGSSCSVTLAGKGSQAYVLGTRISLLDVGDGSATLRVGEETLSCTPGKHVAAGAIILTCTSVTDGVAEFTVTSR
jgi:hypothetical protein